MGLDMYLTMKYYIGAEYEWNKITGTVDIYADGQKIPIELKDVKSISVEVAYWRKVNQIHKWFVDNVQAGEDDCREYYVSDEQLKELIAICKKVLENHDLADELLPTQDGFFFGPTEYAEYYYQCLEDTIAQLSKLDLSGENYKISYYYDSSW